jgi:uncharacterized protein
MEAAEHQVRQWLEQVVIGLNLCPFAGAPYRNGLIRISVSRATTAEMLLAHLQCELVLIDATPATTVETTLLVIADLLADFDEFNDFLGDVETLLQLGGWAGKYQAASFHPHYRFRGAKEDDPSNLTNRSPWPIVHIIRELSIDTALSTYPEPETIPDRNIRTMRSLSPDTRRAYFPWLPKAPISKSFTDCRSEAGSSD